MKKNRTVIGIICIVAALGISFGIAPLANRVLSNKTEIVRLKKDVTKGKKIAASDLERVSVGSYNVPDKAIKDSSQVIGKYAASDMYSGDYIFAEKLNSSGNTSDDVFLSLDGSRQAMSIRVSSYAAGMSGKLQNGDIVTIMINYQGNVISPEELTYVKVITTTTSAGVDKDSMNASDQPATITLMVTKEQAEILAKYDVGGNIYFALVYRGEEENAEKFITFQDDLLLCKYGDGRNKVNVGDITYEYNDEFGKPEEELYQEEIIEDE